MNFFKQLFKKAKEQPTKPIGGWTMFSTSKAEVKEFLVSIGNISVGDNFIKIKNNPFKPSIVYNQPIITADEIDDIDLIANPPAIRIKNELIYLSADKRNELQAFAERHNIQTVERPRIWECTCI